MYHGYGPGIISLLLIVIRDGIPQVVIVPLSLRTGIAVHVIFALLPSIETFIVACFVTTGYSIFKENAIYFFEMSVLFETGELNACVYDGGGLYRRKYVRTESKGRQRRSLSRTESFSCA